MKELLRDTLRLDEKLKTVLMAILKTIELGYWNDFGQLATIMTKMEEILRNCPSNLYIERAPNQSLAQSSSQAMKLFTKENLIMIDCQLITTLIIDRISDF